jgi:hypothetical protein
MFGGEESGYVNNLGWGGGMFSILVGRDFCACVEIVFRRKITESNIQRGWVGRVWRGELNIITTFEAIIL